MNKNKLLTSEEVEILRESFDCGKKISQISEKIRIALCGRLFSNLIILLLAIIMVIGCCRTANRSTAQEGPNILLVSLDTLRYDAISIDENSKNHTPFLKSLANVGIYFTNAYSTYDSTLESHFSMLTGYLHGFQTELDCSEAAIAYQLHQQGYSTFGIAANANLSQYSNRWLMEFENYVCLVDVWNELEADQKQRLIPDSDQRILAYEGVLNDWNRMMVFASSDQVLLNLKRMIRSVKKPFFGFINFNDTHDPYYPDPSRYSRNNEKMKGYASIPDLRFRPILPVLENPELIEDLSQREFVMQKIKQAGSRPWSTTLDLEPAIVEIYRYRYKAEVRDLDFELENLFNFLRTENLLLNTIVIITSDHGESFGELQLITHAFNNQGDQESTHHIPLLFIFPPDYGFKGKKVSIPCTIADIPPTISDFLRINWFPMTRTALPGNFGKSLCPYIETSTSYEYKSHTITSGWKQMDQYEKQRVNEESKKRLKSLGYIK